MAFKRSGVQSPSSPPKKSTNHAGSRTCVVILFLAIFQKVIHLQAFYFAYRKPHWSWKDQCGSSFYSSASSFGFSSVISLFTFSNL